MPLLDVTEVLADPMFQTSFDVVRSVQSVTSGGLGQDAPSTTPGVSGVVTAVDANNLVRIPEGERQEGAIQVYTKFRLTAGSGNLDADVVVWPTLTGSQYTVVNVDDWSQFGAGYILAVCTLKPLSP